jgi:uncharacterized repeat protein (TIGR01451 family)
VTAHVGPGARESRASAVTSAQPSASADATYAASYALRLSRTQRRIRTGVPGGMCLAIHETLRLSTRMQPCERAPPSGSRATPADNLDAVDVCARKVTLRLSKVAAHPTVRAGGLMTYSIRVTNPTHGMARNVKSCDRLPAGLVYVALRSKARLAGGSYCWTAKALAAGKSRRYGITVRVLSSARGSTTNRATATGAESRTHKDRAAIRVLPARAQGGGVTG